MVYWWLAVCRAGVGTTGGVLEHGIHAGGESEVDDVDAMMHDELYYGGSAW